MGPGHRSSNGELSSVRADLLARRPQRESALEARFHDSASTVYLLSVVERSVLVDARGFVTAPAMMARHLSGLEVPLRHMAQG